ncbi:MAG: hypothetical protein O2795_10080 [Acidobacteria bacterium]|nr:hypothetical protein [Acidobacteriota bacterium]
MWSSKMRATLAVAVSAILLLLVSGVALLECPFLTADATTKASQCPRTGESNHPPQCPYAPSLETCPYYLTDGKLNFVEARVEAVVPAAVGFQPDLEAPATDSRSLVPSRRINDRDLHIRLRVLLI